MKKQLMGIAALVAVLSVGVGAQDAASLISQTSKAIGAEGLTSITYSGSAADVNFLQTKNINPRGRCGRLRTTRARST